MAVIFHRTLSLDEAIRLIEEKLGGVRPLGVEVVKLDDAYGRVLAEDVYARVDSPPFDRSNVDGYAVVAEDTYGASEVSPVRLRLAGRVEVGSLPNIELCRGSCVEIATGAPIPRGANAVVMVEHTKPEGDSVLVFRGASPGENIAQTGSDASVGDLILRRGRRLGARELAALAAVGCGEVRVYVRPKVALFSTGGELVPLTEELGPGKIYDVNSHALRAMLRDLGAEVDFLGIVPDSYPLLKRALEDALEDHDVVVTSGSTSAGLGDMIYRVFGELGEVVVHGLRIKPGKPTAVAITGDGKIVFGLPGFPLSAMMVFMVLVKPVLAKMMGMEGREEDDRIRARIPIRLEVGRGRRNLIPVQVLSSPGGLVAYPVLEGSGAATALSISDGFIDVEEERQYIFEDEEVEVKLFQHLRPSSINVVGSNCPAVGMLLDLAGLWDARLVNVGSLAGWRAIKRGEADVAGTHLLDPETGQYNVHMLRKMGLVGEAEIYRGYVRTMGLVVQKGNPKRIKGLEDILREDVIFVNRVKGSGARTFLDVKLSEMGVREPEKAIRGYSYEVKTHTAVASAVAQGRADAGIAIGYVAKIYGLDFIPLADELFDFAVRRDRLEKRGVQLFLKTLRSQSFREKLKELPYYAPVTDTGERIDAR